MKSTGRIQYDASEEENLDKQMEDEVIEVKKLLDRYIKNIDSLLDYKRAKEVKKSMINYLVEQL